MSTTLSAEDERYIRKMLADREYYGAANDAIPTLLAEVERLRLELDNAHAGDHQWASHLAVKSEAERLRQALKDIANVLGTGTCTQPNCPGCHYEMVEAATYAREALAEP